MPFPVSAQFPKISSSQQFSGRTTVKLPPIDVSSADVSAPVQYNSTILTAVGGCLGSCAAVVGLLVGGLVLLIGKAINKIRRTR